ncbi:MAG: hypothetical protein FJ272_08115, partial [Planctomycetes bacterium]|nr:hypothetical protein [Planctomycetota bacterium]
ATPDEDYGSVPPTQLEFPPGVTTQYVVIQYQGDGETEDDETVFVNLGNPSNVTISKGRGVLTIDDDDPPFIEINDVEIVEGDSGSKDAVLTVTLSNDAEMAVTVDYETRPGTASPGADYAPRSGQIRFGAGDTEETLRVPVYGDTEPEDDETVLIRLSNPAYATIKDGEGILTILDDDGGGHPNLAAILAIRPPGGGSDEYLAEAGPGDWITIEWEIWNLGLGGTETGWSDRVLLSADGTAQFGDGNDILLATYQHSEPLGWGPREGIRTVSQTVQIPSGAQTPFWPWVDPSNPGSGHVYQDYHVMLVIDSRNQVDEGSDGEADNEVIESFYARGIPESNVQGLSQLRHLSAGGEAAQPARSTELGPVQGPTEPQSAWMAHVVILGSGQVVQAKGFGNHRPLSELPQVIGVSPSPAAVLSVPPTEVGIVLSEEINPTTLTPAAFQIVGAGRDQTFGTSDDVAVASDQILFDSATRTATFKVRGTLAEGDYRVTLADSVKDLSGNALDGEGNYAVAPVDVFPSGDGTAGGRFASTFRVDTAPPHVIGVTRVGDAASTRGLVLQFDDALDAMTAEDWRNYSLVGSGPGRVFGDGNDVAWTGNMRPVYDANLHQAQLDFSDRPLTTDVWRLTVRNLRDSWGRILDGEFTDQWPTGNGTAGGDFVYDLYVSVPPVAGTGILAVFTVPQTLGAGDKPLGLASGDMDGDGWDDLVAPNYDADTVDVFLNSGFGTFARAASITTSDQPRSVALADLDGDGRRDILVLCRAAEKVHVYRNMGNVQFESRATLITGNDPGRLALGDLNNDGRDDMVVTHTYDDKVGVFLGNGDGTFGPRRDEAAGDGPYGLALGHLNADGKLDMAVTDRYADQVRVWLGNGDGTFGSPSAINVGDDPLDIAIADMDGDLKNDLIVANHGSSNVSVLAGLGTGAFGAARTTPASNAESIVI